MVDGPLIRACVVTALRTMAVVVEADDFATALDVLSTSRVSFDAAIVTCRPSTDHPHASTGVDVMRAMFARWPWIPVVTIAARDEVALMRAAVLLSGARECLREPFGPTDLVGRVERVLGKGAAGPIRTPAATLTIRRILGILDKSPLAEVPGFVTLANIAGMSRSHFSRTFHAVAGMRLRDYVRSLRLERVHELLCSSRLPLTTIAMEAGFYDLPHLDKTFRQRVGLSPHAFRGRYAAGPEQA